MWQGRVGGPGKAHLHRISAAVFGQSCEPLLQPSACDFSFGFLERVEWWFSSLVFKDRVFKHTLRLALNLCLSFYLKWVPSGLVVSFENFFLLLLYIQPRALCLIGKFFSIEPQPQS